MNDTTTKGLLLHVGLPKTGSKTLQRALFTHYPQIYYLGKNVTNSTTKKKCLNEVTYKILKRILWETTKPMDMESPLAL